MWTGIHYAVSDFCTSVVEHSRRKWLPVSLATRELIIRSYVTGNITRVSVAINTILLAVLGILFPNLLFSPTLDQMTPILEKPHPTDQREQGSEERKRSVDECWIVTRDVEEYLHVHGRMM